MFKRIFVVMTALLFVSVIMLALNVKPAKADAQTVYVNADGSIIPAGAPIVTSDNITYVFTGNMSYPDYYGIVVQRSNIIIDGKGYAVQGGGIGLNMTGVSNVTIKNTNFKSLMYGIILDSSSNNSVYGNSITNNGFGVKMNSSLSNTISRNGITKNGDCDIWLLSSSNYNSISGNNVTDSLISISLAYSSNYNNISGNNITNSYFGIDLFSLTDYSVISGNNIANNSYGIGLDHSSGNRIYHNNMENTNQVSMDTSSFNLWDNGYPAGGNYWSNYVGTDLKSGVDQDQNGSDGIGDASFAIGPNNWDQYPLMASITMFDAGTWNGTAYQLEIESNSTISNMQIDTTNKRISFDVTGPESTCGLCRVTIPNAIIQNLWQGNYTVLLNGEQWSFENWTDATNTYIYVNYTLSEHEVTIVPEYPQITVLPILTALSTLALALKRRATRKLKAQTDVS